MGAKIGEKKLVETPRSSKVTPASTPAGPVVKKPISAFKSVPSPVPVPKPAPTPLVESKSEDSEETPVYVPSEPPKLSYKNKHRMKESQVLNSLFREDTDHEDMKPPSKE